MIYFIKKYWKYLSCIFIFLLMIAFSCFYYLKDNKVSTPSVKKLSLTKEQSEKTSTVFVDVKVAVNAPGVYELDDGRRVIDAINLAGGLRDNADTININLSKKLTDEMYIVIYTKEEIYNYKKSNEESNEVKCASFECICPDVNNNACITNNSNNEQKEDKNENQAINGKVSINTATKEELMTLTGIGEAKADAIINYRNENGSFKQIEDIKNVSGIGDSVFEKIKDNIIL